MKATHPEGPRADRPKPVVFLGPSMPVAAAAAVVDAEFRPPIQRGDLAAIEPGRVVAIIDGVFEQDLAVSPREIGEALDRGIVLFGGASMGALRAAEVPGIIGVGRVFEWYRDGVISRDDEVALLFDPCSGEAQTVPTVNVRFAVSRLISLGTITQATGARLVAAALEIPFKGRTWPRMLEAAGLLARRDSGDLMAMLDAHDLKRRDAQDVLEALDRHLRAGAEPRPRSEQKAPAPPPALAGAPPVAGEGALIWESGDHVSHDDLHDFLAFTGKLEAHARSVLARLAMTGALEAVDQSAATGAQRVLVSAAQRWGWGSSEEARVTLGDLGLDEQSLDDTCAREAAARTLVRRLVTEDAGAFRRALRADLFLDELALKREVMRLGALRSFARTAEEPPTPGERAEAKRVLCKVNGAFHFSELQRRWAAFGLEDPIAHEAFVDLLARARRAARPLAEAMTGQRRPPTSSAEGPHCRSLERCPKPAGERRFCLPLTQAEAHARRLGEVIGVTRIGMIGELGDLGSVQVAQAARPGNGWSSSYGSGKSRTPAGAVVGSILEEVEKWAQEQFHPEEGVLVGGYEELRGRLPCVDPGTLDLPFDTTYRPDLPLHWHPCDDLLGGRRVWVPLDALVMERRKNDIHYTRRGSRKHLATNGLGSGFHREEAILHGLCEYVERHAQRLSELFLANPGGLGSPPYTFVDLDRAPLAISTLAAELRRRDAVVRVLDITCEIGIPTFAATITRELQRADGFGAHPHPATAIEMALLEAAQTIASATAGGREDLSIHARSLGRHERPRPVSHQDAWFWLDPDAIRRPVDDIQGFSSDDVREDLTWCLDRIRAAGVERVLVADLTPPGIEPAHVVRVIVPGLETNNPFYTGPRARLLLARDLLPRWR